MRAHVLGTIQTMSLCCPHCPGWATHWHDLPQGLRRLQSNALGIRPLSGLALQLREKIPAARLGAPSLPLPYQQDRCHDLLQEHVYATRPNYICLCYKSIFPLGGVGCSFPKGLAFAKIGPVVGSTSGWRPETHILEGALGF